MIYGGPSWCHGEPLFSWFETNNRNFIVFGDDFAGNMFAFDADNNNKIVLLDHEDMDTLPFDGNLRVTDGKGFSSFDCQVHKPLQTFYLYV